jgi:hypothetical protein
MSNDFVESPGQIMGCQVVLNGTMGRGRSDGPREPQVVQRIQQFARAGL